MRAAAGHVLGSPELAGRSVTIVGLGGVGEPLARRLAADGARLAVTDIDPGRQAVAAEIGAEWIALDGAQRRECDILAPCALGATLTSAEAAALSCRLVVGAANNQLAHDGVAAELAASGIVWVPDFLANAGGLLFAVSVGRDELSREQQGLARVDGLGATALEVLRRADAEATTTLAAAIALADERLSRA